MIRRLSLSVILPIFVFAFVPASAHAQRLEQCKNGTHYIDGKQTDDRFKTCTAHEESDLVLLFLAAEAISPKGNRITGANPPCVGDPIWSPARVAFPNSTIPNMGQEVAKSLVRAGSASDGIGDDGGWRTFETDGRARCRVVAIAIPVGLKDVTQIRTVVHVHNSGNDIHCPDLRVTQSGGNWTLEGPNRASQIGCPDQPYMVIDSLQAKELAPGKGAIGAVFKNWRGDTALTLQFWVWYRRASSPK